MGWTYTHKETGVKAREFLRKELQQDYIPAEKTGFKILTDTATLTEYYAVIERTDHKTGAAERFCLVCLIRNCGDYHNFGWKEMEESMGPFVIPPRSFFNALEHMIPEPDGEYGREWRERCRAYYARLDALPTFKVGDEIELYEKRFRLIADLKRSGFRAVQLPFGRQYRIKRTQFRSATLLDPTPQPEAAPCN
ncbi:MAG: hypothetical protein WC807_16565 [Hyphomicrobium sp.]|jgi:hypothetical protein